MNETKLIIVGGFLAAGKTTMLNTLASRLTARGYKVGLITNDQAANLVDTAVLTCTDVDVREVSGSCFCCNFQGFMDAIQSLIDSGANLIIAEPVGSCTDISATILQPVKDKFPKLNLAPFSVMVDPLRLKEALELIPGSTHPDALYIVKRQLEEADRILLNKVDMLSPAQIREAMMILSEHFPAPSSAVSALHGTGVEQWIDEILASRNAGTHLTMVDYDRYAHGEAVLGWLNASVNLSSTAEISWSSFVQSLLANLKEAFISARAEIGHVKLSLTCNGVMILGNLGSINAPINVRGDSSFKSEGAEMILNARVQMSPDHLQKNVEKILAETAESFSLSAEITTLECLMPGRPNPTYRYHSIV